MPDIPCSPHQHDTGQEVTLALANATERYSKSPSPCCTRCSSVPRRLTAPFRCATPCGPPPRHCSVWHCWSPLPWPVPSTPTRSSPSAPGAPPASTTPRAVPSVTSSTRNANASESAAPSRPPTLRSPTSWGSRTAGSPWAWCSPTCSTTPARAWVRSARPVPTASCVPCSPSIPNRSPSLPARASKPTASRTSASIPSASATPARAPAVPWTR